MAKMMMHLDLLKKHMMDGGKKVCTQLVVLVMCHLGNQVMGSCPAFQRSPRIKVGIMAMVGEIESSHIDQEV